MKRFDKIRRFLLVCLFILATGCSEGPLTAQEEGIRLGDLIYRAEIIPENTSLESDPMSLRAVVTVFNPTGRLVTLNVSSCTVSIRAYEAVPYGALLWEPGGECPFPPQTITFEPGTSQSFEFHTAEVWLAWGLPDGRYFFTALFRLADETIELPAGSAEVRFAVPGLRYDVETTMTKTDPRSLEAFLTVTNENDEVVRLWYGSCSLNLFVYRTADRSEAPVFDVLSFYARSRIACPDYLAIADLQPGASLLAEEFQLRIPVADVLGDTLEAGRYYFSVSLEHNLRTQSFEAGSAVLTR